MTTNSRLLRALFQGFFFGVIGALLCHVNCIMNPRDKPNVDGKAVLEVGRLRAADYHGAEERLQKAIDPVKIAHSSGKYAST